MCGRYQFSQSDYAEFDEIVRSAENRAHRRESNFMPAGDICPTQIAPAIIYNGRRIVGDFQTWGMRRFGKTIINARAETVTEKPMFRANILAQRCVIPASAYYEWDTGRHKYCFRIPGQPLYLAGIYDVQDGINCFVVLTTAPNESVRDIHNRMPLILQRADIRPWMTDNGAALELLAHPSPLLQRVNMDGQISMADLME